MARRLDLQKHDVQNANFRYLGAYRLRVTASDPEDTGADPNVFLFLRRPIDPVTGQQDDIFQAVASPADMSEYPVGQPDDNTTYPMFRSDSFEIDLRAVSLANEVWTIVVTDVGRLLKALDILDTLTPSTTVTVGTPAESGASSGSSISG